jgi:serine protease Do
LPFIEERWDDYTTTTPLVSTEWVLETEEETETEEEVRVVETESDDTFTLEEYQKIQTRLYSIGNNANRSIVTITSVMSDTDWFNNPYEMEGQGSGTIIDEGTSRLWILTEKKVISDASEIYVTFCNDAVASAELVKYDGNTGLALLSVDKSKLSEETLSAVKVMVFGSTGALHKGSVVIALGSPQGINYAIQTGTITATDNEVSTQDRNYSVYSTDITANKNSSGILINTNGELVAVVMQSYGSDASNTLAAVGITSLEPVLNLLFSGKDVPYMGILGSTVTDRIAEQYELPKGVYVKEVTIDSPAMDAGIQSGDVIIGVNGQEVMSVSTFNSVLFTLEPSETYKVDIMREGKNGYQKITCKVRVGILK